MEKERLEYWKIASNQLEDSRSDESEDEKSKKKSLFTDERYQEPDVKSLSRKCDQWRMKERVFIHLDLLKLLFLFPC